MSFFDKTSYLRALFVMLPLGLLGLYFGFSGLLETESGLNKHEGVVTYLKVKPYFQEDTKKIETSAVLELDSSKLFSTPILKNINIIKNELNIGDRITLWTQRDMTMILKLSKKETQIIAYNPTTGIDILILAIGLILTPLSIAYLIKFREDLSGKNK